MVLPILKQIRVKLASDHVWNLTITVDNQPYIPRTIRIYLNYYRPLIILLATVVFPLADPPHIPITNGSTSCP
jgi:hypothetical protein